MLCHARDADTIFALCSLARVYTINPPVTIVSDCDDWSTTFRPFSLGGCRFAIDNPVSIVRNSYGRSVSALSLFSHRIGGSRSPVTVSDLCASPEVLALINCWRVSGPTRGGSGRIAGRTRIAHFGRGNCNACSTLTVSTRDTSCLGICRLLAVGVGRLCSLPDIISTLPRRSNRSPSIFRGYGIRHILRILHIYARDSRVKRSCGISRCLVRSILCRICNFLRLDGYCV